MDSFLIVFGCCAFAAGGVVTSAVILGAWAQATRPQNQSGGRLGRLLVVSHPEWRNQ